MNSMPLLSSHNCFNVLYVEQINDIATKTQDVQKPDPCCIESQMEAFSSMTSSVQTRCPKWERSLPQKFVIAAIEENPTSLKLKVEIETTDTAEKKSVSALVDCGATGEFIDRHYAKSSHFNLVKLTEPIPVCNVNSTLNEAGSVTEVVSLIFCYKNHSERTTFAVCGLGKHKLILGHSWLWKHNPEIDCVTQEVKMSRCPPWSCPGCRDEAHQEHATQKTKSWRNDICTAGPIPEISHNSDSPDEDVSDIPPESLCIEEGDRILATSLMLCLEGFPSVTFFSDTLPLEAFPSTTIGASSTISQHLAEAFKANFKAQSPPIPEYPTEFTSVFQEILRHPTGT